MVRLGRGGRGVVELTFRGQPVVQILPRPATASHIELIRPNRDPIVIEAGSRTVFRLRACFCHAAPAANLMPTTRRHYSARSAIVSISRRSQSIRETTSCKLQAAQIERRTPSAQRHCGRAPKQATLSPDPVTPGGDACGRLRGVRSRWPFSVGVNRQALPIRRRRHDEAASPSAPSPRRPRV